MGVFRPLSQTKFINDANLVSYWKLEDTSDSKGTNTLTNNNTVTFTAGQFNNAGTFSGSNYLSVNSDLGISGGNITMSAWVKLNTASGDIWHVYQAGTTNDVIYKLGTNTSTGFKFDRTKQGVANQTLTYSTVLPTTGVWYHLLMTYDGTNINGYINGSSVGSLSASGNGTTNVTSRVSIGAEDTTAKTNGQIDDTAIFSRALSAGEVAELYQSMTLGEYLPNSSTKLLLHLNGSSADSSGNANNGTDTAITYSQANGKFGQGAGFNGSSSRIATGVTGLPSGAGARTLSCWFNMSALPTNNGAIFACVWYGEATNTTNKNCYIGVGQASGATNVQIGFWSNDLIANISLSTGVWYHLLGTYDGTTASIYLNGVLISSAVKSGVSTSINLARIGDSSTNAEANFFSGAIDESFIESRAWSASEVRKYYTYSRGMFGI